MSKIRSKMRNILNVNLHVMSLDNRLYATSGEKKRMYGGSEVRKTLLWQSS